MNSSNSKSSVMKPLESNMKLKVKLFFFCLSTFLSLTVLLGVIYHGVSIDAPGEVEVQPYPFEAKWKERAPRSLSKDYDTYLQENEVEVPVSTDYRRFKSNVALKAMVATATKKPATALDDLFITVKTTQKFHKSRLDIIIKTWLNLAKEQTWFFTDIADQEYNRRTGGHLINTNCSSSHNRRALCCKMAKEFDSFLESNKRWWCHFDDDNYVNIPALVRTLELYDPVQDWYLGKPSIRAPLEIMNRDNISQKLSFWFATGGAGFCISRSLALKMMPIAGGGKFMSIGEKIRLPDDVTMGYIIEHLLNKKLTLIEQFHSHLEPMRFINTDTLSDQISFSYSKYGAEMNALPIDGFSEGQDPTRLLSAHCKLFPSTTFCAR